ncbi:hypothetical protein [uncultured Tateyamaria sp.]|uniref:hypothetical protein n=1 Tax=Tateyamaria sp. 1078 TaxID=3417464 RepID=UPI00263176D0|nr:hypothetical protein [uncultured Tateyamaria sp.]
MLASWSTWKLMMLSVAIVVACVAQSDAQPKLLQHSATEAGDIPLANARQQVRGGHGEMAVVGRTRIITSNGVPTHRVGQFPNARNPNPRVGPRHRFEMPVSPRLGAARPLPRGASFGVAVNDVPFDPNAAEFW